jgi:hypothetical protein
LRADDQQCCKLHRDQTLQEVLMKNDRMQFR